MMTVVSASSSSRRWGMFRCTDRCRPRTRHAFRSDTPRRCRTAAMHCRRRSGLRSFPWQPLSESSCPASDPTRPCGDGRSPGGGVRSLFLAFYPVSGCDLGSRCASSESGRDSRQAGRCRRVLPLDICRPSQRFRSDCPRHTTSQMTAWLAYTPRRRSSSDVQEARKAGLQLGSGVEYVAPIPESPIHGLQSGE